MEFKPPPPNQAAWLALKYFSRYSYPLTLREIFFWQPRTRLSLSQITRLCSSDRRIFNHGDTYTLSPSGRLSLLRRRRQKISLSKWEIARQISRNLSRISWVAAVFVTGSLAMDSCQAGDDIDIFLVTTPDTLWITRFLAASYLKLAGLRRPPGLPEHSSFRVANKICDNLYLDTNHLRIDLPAGRQGQSLYLAHELLQARCLFDRGGVHRRLLTANSWAADYLPIAYHQTLKKTSNFTDSPPNQSFNLIIKLINNLFYGIQYLYMKPRLTSEKIGPGFAFFHPRSGSLVIS
jgi:hypothetical protein